MIQQIEILLPEYPRGIHIITRKIKENLTDLPETGLVNLFLCHTSAALSINENADPTVRSDMNGFIDRFIPDFNNKFNHTCEGPDDMPSHLKSAVFGVSVTIPVSNHDFSMGTWQGIYLCEFRNDGGQRKIIATIFS